MAPLAAGFVGYVQLLLHAEGWDVKLIIMYAE